jgi:hypothetical protein
LKSLIALLSTLTLLISSSLGAGAAEINPVANKPVKVYVIDGGYSTNKYFKATIGPDFSKDKGTSLEGLDCDRSVGGFHGNKTSGLIRKYAGKSEIEIVSIKIFPCDSDYRNSYWSIHRALNWIAKNHPKGELGVVNLSATTGRYGSLLELPLRKLELLGVPVVASAGNYGGDACNHYTAKSNRTITVGALDRSFTKVWKQSNTGECVDYYAGSFHTCVESGSKLTKCNGTSFAAPVITAKIVNFMYKFPGSRISDIRKMLAEDSKTRAVAIGGESESIRYHATPRKS